LNTSTLNVDYPECQHAECRYAECHKAECHYAECRGVLLAIAPSNAPIKISLVEGKNSI
jgi:hypothetical protein